MTRGPGAVNPCRRADGRDVGRHRSSGARGRMNMRQRAPVGGSRRARPPRWRRRGGGGLSLGRERSWWCYFWFLFLMGVAAGEGVLCMSYVRYFYVGIIRWSRKSEEFLPDRPRSLTLHPQEKAESAASALRQIRCTIIINIFLSMTGRGSHYFACL